MPRPKQKIRRQQITLTLPPDVIAKAREVTQTSISALVEKLLTRYFQK